MQSKNNSSLDNINLLELCSILWKGKWVIFLTICIGIAFSIIYIFTAKEEWISKAQVTLPNENQLVSYTNLQKEYNRIIEKKEDFKTQDSVNNAYKNFIAMLSSSAIKRQFLRDTEYYKQKVFELDNTVMKSDLLQDLIDKKFNITKTFDKRNNIHDVSFVSEKEEDSRLILENFIEEANKKALHNIYQEMHKKIEDSIVDLEYDLNLIRFQQEQIKKNKIVSIEYAIVSAKKENISEFSNNEKIVDNVIIDSSLFENMFFLGEKYLIAQLNVMKNSPIIYPVNYHQKIEKIKELKKLFIAPSDDMTFRYAKNPSLSLNMNKSKKTLIVFLGFVFGGLLGVLYVIIFNIIRNRNHAF